MRSRRRHAVRWPIRETIQNLDLTSSSSPTSNNQAKPRPQRQSTAMLSIDRPTPTTILYTVSTRSSPTTLTSRALTLVSLLLRLLIGLLVISTLLEDCRQISYFCNLNILNRLSNVLADSPFDKPTILLNDLGNPTIRLVVRALVSVLLFRKFFTQESLLVIRGLGVQTSTSSSSYLGSATTRFIPTTSIQDIFIHEAFKGFEVRFYLGIVVEGEESVVVVFPVRVLPRPGKVCITTLTVAETSPSTRGFGKCLARGADVSLRT